MADRVTYEMLDRSCESLTATMHDAGTLHADSAFVRGGEYGVTVIRVTGGPHYGSGSSDLVRGTRRECLDALHAIARARELGRTSLGRD